VIRKWRVSFEGYNKLTNEWSDSTWTCSHKVSKSPYICRPRKTTKLKTARGHMMPPLLHLSDNRLYRRCYSKQKRATNERTNEGVHVDRWKMLNEENCCKILNTSIWNLQMKSRNCVRDRICRSLCTWICEFIRQVSAPVWHHGQTD